MDNVKEYFSFQISRNVTNLFKDFLVILDGLKLKEDEHQRLRKSVLDKGNGTIREINFHLEKLDIRLK